MKKREAPAAVGRRFLAEAMYSKDGVETSREDDGDSTPLRKNFAMAARKLRPGDDTESKSLSSENNQDGASADDLDLDAPATKRRGRKASYRHTQHQIQEMERLASSSFTVTF